MRMVSGITDQYIYFVAVDATDFTTRETGLTGFTVYRSRDGGVAAAMTTPTINETDATNMPGVYELLLDEDMTIGAGNDSEEMVFHITVAGMAPVTRTIELYRAKTTVGTTATVVGTSINSNMITTGSGAISLASFQANSITASALAADAVTEIQAGLATAAALTTVDTVVDGIQTDLSNATDGLGAIKAETALILADTTLLDKAIYTGTADSGTTYTMVDATYASGGLTWGLPGDKLKFTSSPSGDNTGRVVTIVSRSGSTITFEPILITAVTTEDYMIFGRGEDGVTNGDLYSFASSNAIGHAIAINVVGANVAAVLEDTGTTLPGQIGFLPTAEQNADALLDRDMSAVTVTNARSPINAFRFLRNKWSISGTTLTVTKEDDTTLAWTATTTASSGADPVIGFDPD